MSLLEVSEGVGHGWQRSLLGASATVQMVERGRQEEAVSAAVRVAYVSLHGVRQSAARESRWQAVLGSGGFDG